MVLNNFSQIYTCVDDRKRLLFLTELWAFVWLLCVELLAQFPPTFKDDLLTFGDDSERSLLLTEIYGTLFDFCAVNIASLIPYAILFTLMVKLLQTFTDFSRHLKMIIKEGCFVCLSLLRVIGTYLFNF